MKWYILIIVCSISLSLSGKNWEPVYQPFDSLTNLWEQSMGSSADIVQKRQWLREMYAIAREHKARPVFMWRAMHWEAWLLQKTDQPDSAFAVTQRALKMVDTLQYEYDYKRLQKICINHHENKGDYLAAYKACKSQLRFYEQIGDTLNMANIYVSLGNMLNNFHEANKALVYLQKAEHIYRSIGKTANVTGNRLNIANSLYLADRRKEAVDMLENILTTPIIRQDTAFHLQVLASMCSYIENDERGEKYTREAYSLAQSYGKIYPIIKSSINMGAIFFKKANPDSALYYYRKAWNYLQKHDDNEILLPTLNGIAFSFRQKQQWDSAYIYLYTAGFYRDSLQQVNSLSEVHRIESRAAIERYEANLLRQKEEARMHRIILLLILALVSVLAAVSCYIFWTQRRKAITRKRMQELENRELTTRLEKEQLQNNYYQLEIDSKNRELTSTTLMLIEKNKMMEELMKRISSGGETGEIGKRTVLELKNQIKAHACQEDEWQFFRIHFEQVHPGFFNKLKNLCPTLTEGELRLCAYIRTGMENKQIAQMLSQQPDTIKKARYRLRKKTPIGQEDSLEDFLRSI